MNKDIMIGMFLTLLGGTLWGLSGTCAQFIQQERGISPEWLVTVRLFVAGIITFLWSFWKKRITIFKVLHNPIDTWRLTVFGLLGMALCQYSYFRSIYYAGAGIATVLQYLAPVMIIIYMVLRYHKKPSLAEVISVGLATSGTILIALKGEATLATVDERVLFWGLLSAVAVAVYSMQPVEILRKYGTGPVVGFGMIIGSIGTFLLWRPMSPGGFWDFWTYMAFLGIVILGTVVSFNAYLEGVRRIGAVQGAILSSIEPISAALIGWALLGNNFTGSDIVGFTMILSTIFILAKNKQHS